MTPTEKVKSLCQVSPSARGKIQTNTITRLMLPELFVELGYRSGAEIGVWQGEYSARFCATGLQMLCVDPWLASAEWMATKPYLSPDRAAVVMEKAYRRACDRLSSCQIVRACSREAAEFVPDWSLDFVYIDGDHRYAAVMDDLTIWSRKVRSGGIVAGHDYRVSRHKPTTQVVKAVDTFTADHAIDPWFVLGDATPSFLWVVA